MAREYRRPGCGLPQHGKQLEPGCVTIERLLDIAQNFACEPGTGLQLSGGKHDAAHSSILWLFPTDRFGVKGPGAWQELESRLTHSGLTGAPEWVGYLGFELGAASVEAPTPDAYFQLCALRIELEHTFGVATVWVDEDAALSDEQRRWCQTFCDESFWRRPFHATPSKSGLLRVSTPLEPAREYMGKVEAIRDLIRRGEVYQVCLSQEAWLEGRSSPFDLFRQLHSRNPAPFSAFLNCGGFSIVSSSPERFLALDGSRLEARPIKGTMPRGRTREEDDQNRSALLTSPKEQAELTMITDLLRNDLGKVSEVGSVQVPELMRCEAYTNVHHLVSIIRSRKLPEITPLEVLRAAFPGGSVSGCPKLRALEIIATLENRPRGVYTGAVGYFRDTGDFDFNIAIRTLVVWPDRINIQLGGAITYDSDPRLEYEETLHKGKTLFEALGVQL